MSTAMIPAKITSLNPAQVMYYKLPEPDPDDDRLEYEDQCISYYDSKVIADVENVEMVGTVLGLIYYVLLNGKCRNIELNQQVFIEPTTEGKCKIIKI
jgi:hypothetical protein